MNFGNLIKLYENKCDYCEKCVNACNQKLIKIENYKINIDIDNCVGCKKCIESCSRYALVYYMNPQVPNGDVAVIGYDSDEKYLPVNYKYIYNLELAEKIKTIEVAFFFTNILNNKINGIYQIENKFYSDIENIKNILKISNNNNINSLINNFAPITNSYQIMYNFLIKKNKNIDFYGVPFNLIKQLQNNEGVQIYNQYLNVSEKYNILDIINTFLRLNKLDDQVIDEIYISNNKVLIFKNKYFCVKFLLCNDIDFINSMENYPYDYIIITKNKYYKANDNLLKDEEINNLYKTKLKSPLKNAIVYK